MKNLSLKLDDNTFEETEKLTTRLRVNRNRYINRAVHFFYALHKKKILSKQLEFESQFVQANSLKILEEFEQLKMKIQQYEIWLADLNPRFGTEAGKVRPVVVLQTNALNKIHPSTIVCPVTTNVQAKANILRVHLKKGEAGMKTDCDIMVDQLRAIDNKRLLKKPVFSQIKKNNCLI